MTTTSYKKAISTLYRIERTNSVSLSYKEVVNDNIVVRKLNIKAYEALNILEYINKVAFVKLVA